MATYTESYYNLYHGTSQLAAVKIISEQKFIASNSDNWCGSGVYFYDNKGKALWAAQRKCNELHKKTGEKHKHSYVCADIININKDDILDLRSFKDLEHFSKFLDEFLENNNFEIDGEISEEEKLIKKRAILISFYAQENKKKLVIGHFQQIPRAEFIPIHSAAKKLQLVVGVETIFCVKDDSILTNIRGANK